MITVGSCHRCRPVEMLQKIDEREQALAALCMRYALDFDSKVISLGQTVKLSKIANISTAIVRCNTTFTDMMLILLRYMRASVKDFGLHFVGVRILDLL